MKELYVLRGAPGCGKTTWIKNNNLELFKLSADDLRLICCEPTMARDGSFVISQENSNFVWDILFEILDFRLRKGFKTVIDATASHLAEIRFYYELAQKYGYELIIVDFGDIPVDRCLVQNRQRDKLRFVPEEVIIKYCTRYSSQKKEYDKFISEHTGIKVIKRN